MRYRIRIHSDAKRDLKRLPGHVRQRMLRLIDDLSADPRPAGSLELDGRPGTFRIWVDRWRLIYEVDNEAHVVGIIRARLKTGPDTYENLPQW